MPVLTLDELRTRYRDDILAIAGRYGIENIRVFGSVARGDAREDSDLDLLVHRTRRMGYRFFDLQEDLEKLLCHKVDMLSDKGLSRYIGPHILAEAVPL